MYNALSRASVVIQLQQDVEQYEATVVSTNGVILQPYDTSTTLIGSVLKNKEDITDKIKDIRWTKWNPSADNLIECPDWNRTHKGSHIIEVSKEDVDSKSIFTFEAYNTKGELLCTASMSIIDINDLLVNTEKPLNPYPGQLWIDERTEPATLYVWNGYKWVIVGSVGTVVKNLLRNTAFLFNTDFWDIVGDTRLSFAPYGVDYLGHRFLKMASGVLTDERRGISQTTEDIIGTGAEYSFQMLYYSKEDTQTYSNNIKVNIYSVNSYGDETLITTKTVQAKADIKRLFFVFETRLDTKDIKVEILGEEGHRYNFFVGEIALYNTANDYPWTMHPLDLQLYGYTQEELWNILSNNGKIQGIFTRINPETGQLEYYINATYIGAGKMKAEYLDAYNLRVLRKDDDIVTLEITDNGDVNLRVNTLIINSANKTIEDIVSQIYMDQNRIELKVDNYKDELSSKISQTAEEIRLEVKNTKEELESNISQTAEQIKLEVKNNKDELESSITQTAEQIRAEVKDTKDQLESSITQTASEIRAEVKDINDGLSSTISQTAEQIRAEVKDVNDNLTSSITQTASQIRLEVSDMDDRLTSSITQTADSIRSEVSDMDERLTSSITQTATDIRSEVKDINDNLTSSITQTAKDIRSEVSELDKKVSSVTQSADQIKAEVKDLEENLTSSITQTAKDIRAEVKDINDNLTSNITQTAKDIRAEVSDLNNNLTSSITQTAKDIRSEVKDINDNLTSSITQTASDIRSEVKDINDNLTSSITQTASDIRSEVSDLDKNLSSKIDQTAKDINLKVADNTKNISSLIDITAEGVYIDSNGSLVDINGEGVTIKATDITLDASNIHLEGYTTINQGFSIDKEGNMTAKDGKFSGTITSTNINSSTITGTTVTGGKIIGTVIQNAETNPTFSVSAEGVITGAAIKGGSIGIGGSKYDAFTVDNDGNCKISKGSISIGGNFVVGTNGILTATGANFTGSINAGSSITGTDINGGTITGTTIKNTNNTFSIDGNGNISGGSITIKDNFKVTSDGKLTAKNASFTGNINSGSTITGATIKNTSGTFQVDADGNIKGAAITGSSVSGGTITGATIQNSSGSFKVDGNGNVKGASISGSSISGGTITGATIQNSDGSFKVDANGNVKGAAISGGTIKGTAISGGSLSIGDGFSVNTSGVLTATGANITGTITSTNGKIGGYTIGEHKLTATNVGMCSNSNVEWAFWAGANAGADAPFHVGHNGYLYASNATITGNITATSGSFTGTITARQGEIGGFTINETTLKGTNVGLCSSTGEWAFWAGASTGGASAFHVGHDGKLYSSSANISGSISGSTITASSFSDPNNFFVVDSDGTVTAQSINIKGEVSAETFVGEYLAIPWYSKTLTKNMTCYIRANYTYPINENNEIDVNQILEDGIYASFDDLQDYVPRNLNGYTLTVNFESDITDQLNIDNFNNGTVRIAFNGHTLKGNIRAIGRSLEILIYGNKPGSTKGSTRGKIVPGKNGYLYNNYTYCIVGDKCRITVYDIDLYAGTTATSSNIIGNNGICCTNGAVGYLSAIKAINEPYALVRSHSVSHVYVESSSGRSKDCTFQAISGSIMHLNDTTQAGTTGSKGTTYTKDNAKIFADGVKYDNNTPVVDPTPVEPPKNNTITVTKTIKSTAGRSWRTSGDNPNSWSTESIVRQGQWTTGYGKNKGYWFFGNDIYNILQNNKNTVTSMTIKITRNSGGANAAVDHYLRAHTISSKPNGAPSDYLGTSTLNKKFSLAVGNSTTLSLSSTEIANLKSSKAKGFGLYNSNFTTGKNGPYSCCSSSCTVTIKYKTTES